jgi:adenosylcobinamide-GDP ribazoletransferase
MKPLFAAFGFLTVLPIPLFLRGDSTDLARSRAVFPFVGLVLGLLVASIDSTLIRLFPVYLTSIIDVIALLFMTGGLHLDGLADTADGFLSGRKRERILEIMKDGSSGPMGVAAVVCVLMLKAAALAAVPSAYRFPVLILMPSVGRCAMVLMMWRLPYARTAGTGFVFAKRPSWIASALSFTIPIAAGCLLRMVEMGAVIWIACLAIAGGLALWSRKKIGGWTGDTLGATSEIEELVPSLVVIAYSAGKMP